MAYLKIRILGRGLIPRGGGIAPRKEPIAADLTLIQTIMASPGLAPFEYINPESGKAMPLSQGNLRKVWEKYANYKALPEKENSQENGNSEDPVQYICKICGAKYIYDDGYIPTEGEELLCSPCEAFKKTQGNNTPKEATTPNITPPPSSPSTPAPVTNTIKCTACGEEKDKAEDPCTNPKCSTNKKETPPASSNGNEKKDEVNTDNKNSGTSNFTFQPRNKDSKDDKK